MKLLPDTNINDNEQRKFRKITSKKTVVATIDGGEHNTVECVQTAIGATATRIKLPELAEKVIIKHITSSTTIWIGKDNTITTSGINVYPLTQNETLELNLQSGDDNNLYGIVTSGPITIYALGAYRE